VSIVFCGRDKFISFRCEHDFLERRDELSDVCLPVSDDALWELCRTVLFGADQLKSLGVQEEAIAPFALIFDEFQRDAQRRSMRMVRRKPSRKGGTSPR
jgi:hypothetical protein